MNTRSFLYLLLIGLMIVPTGVIHAQTTDPVIVGSTVPIGDEMVNAVQVWLTEARPAETRFYSVTYIQSDPTGTFICLAGLNITAADQEWSIEEHGIWFGTIRLGVDGSVHLFAGDPRGLPGTPKVASLAKSAHAGAGGGSYLRFPWEGGKNMLFGQRGIHNKGDFDNDDMWSMNFDGGDSLGSNIARDYVFAVDDGTIDWVCDDANSTAVRTYNPTTGDYFVYAHFLSNANLVMSHSFGQGDIMGRLRRGTFLNLGCGAAIQKSDRYNLYMMFLPQEVDTNLYRFRMEGCELSFVDLLGRGVEVSWMCGSTEVGPGDPLYSSGTDGDLTGDIDDLENPGGSSWDWVSGAYLNFFDLFVGGMVAVARAPLALMPDKDASYWTFRDNVINTVLIFLKIAQVLVKGNLNLGLFWATISFFLFMWVMTFGIRALLRVIKLVAIVAKLL